MFYKSMYIEQIWGKITSATSKKKKKKQKNCHRAISNCLVGRMEVAIKRV